MVDSEFTAGVVIKALDERDVQSFTFRFHEIAIDKFDDTADVLSALVSSQVDNQLEELFVGVFLEGYLLVEDELVGARWWDLSCDRVVIDLDVHLAWELDFHCDRNDVQVVLVNLYFLLFVRHLHCSLAHLFYLFYDLYWIEFLIYPKVGINEVHI